MTAQGEMAGYSGTSLANKLGFRAGCRVRICNAPGNYRELLAGGPEAVTISKNVSKNIDIWHLFTTSAARLESQLPTMMRMLRQDGMICVSWPKKSSGARTTLTEDPIRQLALRLGLVDVKVRAVDDTWSALKLVIRKELRR